MDLYPQQQHPADQGPPAEQRTKKKTKTSHACKECKRLKLKCDKKFPCSSCRKRGCSAICPDGCLTTGKGSRFVLSGSEELHERIDVLTERIRELEIGLGSLHSETNPNVPHPLLEESKMKLKSAQLGRSHVRTRAPPEHHFNPLTGPESDDESEEEGPLRHNGTLKIDERGTSTYFGSTARSEYFLLGPEDLGLPDDPIPLDILLNSHSFPFTALLGSQRALIRKIHAQLPDKLESERLAGIYHERVSWLYDTLPDSEEYVAKLQAEIYHGSSPGDLHTPEIDPHRMALLFTIHGLGSLLDLDKEPYSPDAWTCLDLAKACLAVRPVLDFPSISSIQAMFLMCYFLLLGNKKPDAAWVLMGIIVKVSQSIGLHRDDFELSEDESQERRLLWWEVASLEGWLALGFGRPPAVRLLSVNAKFPQYKPSTIDAGYRGWSHLFGKTCLPAVLEVALGVKTPTYDYLLATEQIVEKSYIPPDLKAENEDSPSVALTFQRAMVITARSLTVMKLHLGWFSQALDENHADLKKSKYYRSVEAVHHSACSLIGSLHHLCTVQFSLVCRFGVFWSNTLSSAVPLCLIATRASSSELAEHSLHEVEHCYEIFARASGRCHPAGVSLPIIRRLRDQAQAKMQEHLNGRHSLSTPISPHSADVDELERLGGKTRLVRGSSQVALSSAYRSQPAQSTPGSSRNGYLSPQEPMQMDSRYAGMSYETSVDSQRLPPAQSNEPAAYQPHGILPPMQNMKDSQYTQQHRQGLPPPQPVYQHQQQDYNPYPSQQYPIQPTHRESNERYAHSQPQYPQHNVVSDSDFSQQSHTGYRHVPETPREDGADFRYAGGRGIPGQQQLTRLDMQSISSMASQPTPSEVSPAHHFHQNHYHQGTETPLATSHQLSHAQPRHHEQQQQYQQTSWPILHAIEPQSYPTSGYGQQMQTQHTPVQTPTNMTEMYHYTQQPDYASAPPQQDTTLYRHQQQIFRNMVSELNIYPTRPSQPPPPHSQPHQHR